MDYYGITSFNDQQALWENVAIYTIYYICFHLFVFNNIIYTAAIKDRKSIKMNHRNFCLYARTQKLAPLSVFQCHRPSVWQVCDLIVFADPFRWEPDLQVYLMTSSLCHPGGKSCLTVIRSNPSISTGVSRHDIPRGKKQLATFNAQIFKMNCTD